VLADTGSIDSRRGATGYFIPIPDITIDKITATESRRYGQIAEYYQQHWRQMDPVMVAVKRFALNRKGLERVVIDANVAPLQEQKYGWILSILGQPTQVRIRPAPGDIVHFQAHVTGGKLSNIVPPHHLFGGIQDSAIDVDLRPTSFWQVIKIMRSTPGYLGAWPKPGFVDSFPLLNGRQVDSDGYSQLLFGVSRRQWGQFSALSFHQSVLERTTPFIRVAKVPSAAQVRLFVGDLSKSKLATWVNAFSYQRAMQTSVGNTRLLNSMAQQLGLPRAKTRMEVERILGTRLLCALGGKYELTRSGQWVSTAWRAGDKYVSPLLGWFRGAKANLTKANDRMILRAQIDMQRKPNGATLTLPLLKFFGEK